MAKVLKAVAASAPAYVERDFGTNKNDLWVTFELFIPATTLAFWIANGEYDVTHFDNAARSAAVDGVYADTQWRNYYVAAGAPAADTWHTIELHHRSIATKKSELYVDGVLIGTETASVTSELMRYIQFGQNFGTLYDPALVVFIDNVRIGTTRGAANVFFDNFESGDLSAWTSTSGDVSVVDLADVGPSSMFTWTQITTPWDDPNGAGEAVIVLPSGRIVVGGYFIPNYPSLTGAQSVMYSDDGGASWTGVSTPWDGGGVSAFGYSPTIGARGRLVACGGATGSGDALMYSDDEGETWTGLGDPLTILPGAGSTTGFMTCVTWGGGKFVAGGFAGRHDHHHVIATSTNGTTWVPRTTPFEGEGVGLGGGVNSILFTGTGWVAFGRSVDELHTEMTSADAVTWSFATGPNDGFLGGLVYDATQDTVNARFITAGASVSVGPVYGLATSPDLSAWTYRSTPFNGGSGQAVAVRAGLALAFGSDGSGNEAILESTDGGASWVPSDDSTLPVPYGGTRIAFIDDATAILVGFPFDVPFVAAIGRSGPPPLPPPTAPATGRFPRPIPWRFLITDRVHRTLACLEAIATERTVTLLLNLADVIACTVPSDDPQVTREIGAGGEEAESIITASDGAASDVFGQSIALSRDGSTLVVGAWGRSGGADRGAVYVYTGAGFATETMITASDGVDGDNFGQFVDVSDDGSVIVVGGNGLATRAYIYSGASWATETIVTPGDGGGGSFGDAVAVSGDGSVAAVGDSGANSFKGKVYLYHGASWGTETGIVASDGASGDGFGNTPYRGSGIALSSDGAVMVTGSYNATVSGQAGAGKAYVYSGASWATETILHAATPYANGNFGSCFAISADGSVLLVGALKFDATAHGAAYIRSGAGWATELRLTASDGTANDNFGLCVSLNATGDTVLVGAAQANFPGPGQAYLYAGASFATETILTPSDGVDGDDYGDAVTLVSTSLYAVGADNRGGATGAVYLYAVTSTAGRPVVEELDRFLLAFRRDEAGSTPWTFRAGGPVLQVNDVADPDRSVTKLTAWAPMKLWDALPAVVNGDGDLVPQAGLIFTATPGDVIAQGLIADSAGAYLVRNPDASQAEACQYIDWGSLAAGGIGCGTDDWAGTLEATGNVDVTIQQAAMLGPTLGLLIAKGSFDIVMTPIYDPVNRPGYLYEGSIVAQAGQTRHGTVFGWDTGPMNLNGIERLVDATPGQRVNVAQFYAGQGGLPVTRISDPDSIAFAGEMWMQQFWPGENLTTAIETLATLIIALAKNGKTIVTMSPASERAPVPLIAYALGDRVPVYTGKRFRKPIVGELQRISGIPFTIGDDGTETVDQLIASTDGSS